MIRKPDWLRGLADRLRSVGGGADFLIRYRPGQPVEVRGRVPAAKHGEIAAFLAGDLQPAGPVTIRGSWGSGRQLRLRLDGPLSAGQAQRVRNVLITLLA